MISKSSRLGVGSLIVSKGLPRASKPVSGDLRLFFHICFAPINLFNGCKAVPQKLLHEQDAFDALQQGREQGLDFFFHQYYTPLVCYATSITKNEEAAKEMASECFVKLWNNRTTIEVCAQVRFWLYRTVHNAAVDFLRRQETQTKKDKIACASFEGSEPSILQKLILAETYNRLYQLLNTLPPRSRQIFQMFYFQNKTMKEIATELGVSVNTVKTQKLRAIQTLKQHQGSFYFFIAYHLFFS